MTKQRWSGICSAGQTNRPSISDTYRDIGLFAGALVDTRIIGGRSEDCGSRDDISRAGTRSTILDHNWKTTVRTLVERVLLQVASIEERRPTV
jgi:hypothetical protein